MDTASFGVIATWALPVVACLVALVTTINSTRRVRPDTLRRRVARTVLRPQMAASGFNRVFQS